MPILHRVEQFPSLPGENMDPKKVYLEETSKKEDVTKSKLIRDMIVEHMRKDSS